MLRGRRSWRRRLIERMIGRKVEGKGKGRLKIERERGTGEVRRRRS
jgi:hypothetical protein